MLLYNDGLQALFVAPTNKSDPDCLEYDIQDDAKKL